MEGGSCNDYDYCSGDPVNCTDLSGQVALPDGEGIDYKTVSESSYSYGKYDRAIYAPIAYRGIYGIARIRHRNRYQTITQLGRRITPDGIAYYQRKVRIREEEVEINFESVTVGLPGPAYTGAMTYNDLTGFGSAKVVEMEFLYRTAYGCTRRVPCIVAPWK